MLRDEFWETLDDGQRFRLFELAFESISFGCNCLDEFEEYMAKLATVETNIYPNHLSGDKLQQLKKMGVPLNPRDPITKIVYRREIT